MSSHFVWVVARLFMVAVYLGHLGRLIAVPDVSKYLLKTSLVGKLFLLSFVLDISDAEGVGSAGEGVISSIHIYNIALRASNVKPFFHK